MSSSIDFPYVFIISIYIFSCLPQGLLAVVMPSFHKFFFLAHNPLTLWSRQNLILISHTLVVSLWIGKMEKTWAKPKHTKNNRNFQIKLTRSRLRACFSSHMIKVFHFSHRHQRHHHWCCRFSLSSLWEGCEYQAHHHHRRHLWWKIIKLLQSYRAKTPRAKNRSLLWVWVMATRTQYTHTHTYAYTLYEYLTTHLTIYSFTQTHTPFQKWLPGTDSLIRMNVVHVFGGLKRVSVWLCGGGGSGGGVVVLYQHHEFIIFGKFMKFSLISTTRDFWWHFATATATNNNNSSNATSDIANIDNEHE